MANTKPLAWPYFLASSKMRYGKYTYILKTLGKLGFPSIGSFFNAVSNKKGCTYFT